jgi:hypothetical protein
LLNCFETRMGVSYFTREKPLVAEVDINCTLVYYSEKQWQRVVSIIIVYFYNLIIIFISNNII